MSSKTNTHAHYKSHNIALCMHCTPAHSHSCQPASKRANEYKHGMHIVVNSTRAHSIRLVRTHERITRTTFDNFNVFRPSDFTNIEICLRKSMSPFVHISVLSSADFCICSCLCAHHDHHKEECEKKKQNGTKN